MISPVKHSQGYKTTPPWGTLADWDTQWKTVRSGAGLAPGGAQEPQQQFRACGVQEEATTGEWLLLPNRDFPPLSVHFLPTCGPLPEMARQHPPSHRAPYTKEYMPAGS